MGGGITSFTMSLYWSVSMYMKWVWFHPSLHPKPVLKQVTTVLKNKCGIVVVRAWTLPYQPTPYRYR